MGLNILFWNTHTPIPDPPTHYQCASTASHFITAQLNSIFCKCLLRCMFLCYLICIYNSLVCLITRFSFLFILECEPSLYWRNWVFSSIVWKHTIYSVMWKHWYASNKLCMSLQSTISVSFSCLVLWKHSLF